MFFQNISAHLSSATTTTATPQNGWKCKFSSSFWRPSPLSRKLNQNHLIMFTLGRKLRAFGHIQRNCQPDKCLSFSLSTCRNLPSCCVCLELIRPPGSCKQSARWDCTPSRLIEMIKVNWNNGKQQWIKGHLRSLRVILFILLLRLVVVFVFSLSFRVSSSNNFADCLLFEFSLVYFGLPPAIWCSSSPRQQHLHRSSSLILTFSYLSSFAGKHILNRDQNQTPSSSSSSWMYTWLGWKGPSLRLRIDIRQKDEKLDRSERHLPLSDRVKCYVNIADRPICEFKGWSGQRIVGSMKQTTVAYNRLGAQLGLTRDSCDDCESVQLVCKYATCVQSLLCARETSNFIGSWLGPPHWVAVWGSVIQGSGRFMCPSAPSLMDLRDNFRC